MFPPGNEPYLYWGNTWIWPKRQVRNWKSTTIASWKSDNLVQLSLPSNQRPWYEEGKQRWTTTQPSFKPTWNIMTALLQKCESALPNAASSRVLICYLVKTCSESKLEALLMSLYENIPFKIDNFTLPTTNNYLLTSVAVFNSLPVAFNTYKVGWKLKKKKEKGCFLCELTS